MKLTEAIAIVHSKSAQRARSLGPFPDEVLVREIVKLKRKHAKLLEKYKDLKWRMDGLCK